MDVLVFSISRPIAGTTPVLQDTLGVREIALMSENLRRVPIEKSSCCSARSIRARIRALS